MLVIITDNINKRTFSCSGVKMLIWNDHKFQLQFGNNRYSALYEEPKFTYEIKYKEKRENEKGKVPNR